MTNCNNNASSITLLKKVVLENYPSGSSIEFYNNRFYITGDDATYISILDTNYHPVDSITLFEEGQLRVSKDKKLDLESAVLIGSGKKTSLLVFGSAATAKREVVLEMALNTPTQIKIINSKVFTERLKQAGIKEVNIEGAAIVNDVLVLTNRANESNTVNHLIVTNNDFFNNQENSRLTILEIELPQQKNVMGISGLTYVAEKDILLFTGSTELTGNAYDDGEIGDSYIGWIKNVSTKLRSQKISADGIINLATANKEISTEKIESICVEKYENDVFYIHIISDNDKGETGLFKLKFELH